MQKIETVYIAAPYSAGDIEPNVRNVIVMAHAILDLGITPFVPHLSHYLHAVRARGYEDWMKFDFVWLRRSDSLLRMPGVSPGADREVELMSELGRPIFHTLETLTEYVKASK